MAEIYIEDLNDSRLDPYRALKLRNPARWSGHFIAEGMRLVERLLDSDFEVESILVSEQHRSRLPDNVNERAQVFVAPLSLLENVIGFRFHSGMLACGRRRADRNLFDWLPPPPRPLLLVGCPQTSDPDNLGTIIRIAAGLGADGLLAGTTSADPFSRRTLRISMGTAFYLPIFQLADFARTMQDLQRTSAVTVVGSVLNAAAIPLARSTRPHRMLLLLGNEDDGLPEELVRVCDRLVTIPMAEKIDSLNVGIAAGILLHHFTQVAPQDDPHGESH